MITLIQKIQEHADNQPQNLAVAFKNEQLTYAELNQKIKFIAASLVDLGIKKNDRVLFTALSKPEMVAIYLGIQYAGAIAVFIDKSATLDSISSIYEYSDAALLLADKPFKDLSNKIKIESLRRIYNANSSKIYEYTNPADNDIAEILFTTGTTGKPKGVMLSYFAVENILLNTIRGVQITKEDRLLLALPLNHSFALRNLRAYLWLGAAIILQNGFTFFENTEKNIAQYNCTGMAIVPATVSKLRTQMQDKFSAVLSKLRYIEISAGSLSIAQRKEMPKLLPGVRIMNVWGSSECGGAIFLNVNDVYEDNKKIYALGKPLAGIKVKTLDENGIEITATEKNPGRLFISGDMIMSGYWKQSELSQKTIINGGILTNDLAYIEGDYVYMLGRADDIINVGGEKVSPIEVENSASQVKGVYDCACVGVPDPEGVLGYIPVLFYVSKNQNISDDDFISSLVLQLERYKIPKQFIRVDEIPRNSMKKIDRKAVRKLWDNREQFELKNVIIQNILSRRSIRKFTAQAIPRNIIDVIIEAGYHAPSGHNMQTWLFTVLEKKETIEKLKNAMSESAAKKGVHFYGFENPDVVILISNDMRNHDGCQDSSCAAENMFLAANSYGIGSTWVNALMTLRDVEPAKNILDELGIPENHIVWCTACFGYPVEAGNKLAKKLNVVKYIDR